MRFLTVRTIALPKKKNKKKIKEKGRAFRMAKTWTVDMDPRCTKPLDDFHVKAHHLGGYVAHFPIYFILNGYRKVI